MCLLVNSLRNNQNDILYPNRKTNARSKKCQRIRITTTLIFGNLKVGLSEKKLELSFLNCHGSNNMKYLILHHCIAG